MYNYIDDFIGTSATKEEHLVHLHEVCRRLDEHGIVNPTQTSVWNLTFWATG